MMPTFCAVRAVRSAGAGSGRPGGFMMISAPVASLQLFRLAPLEARALGVWRLSVSPPPTEKAPGEGQGQLEGGGSGGTSGSEVPRECCSFCSKVVAMARGRAVLRLITYTKTG